MHKHALFVVLVAIVFAACQKTPEKIISISPDEFSTEDQLKIGAAFRDAVAANPDQFPLLNPVQYPEAYDYVRLLFNTMLQTAPVEHRSQYEWTVDIVENDTLATAFFLPGGHFYIYTGLLKFLDSESQLIGVIGHEMYYADSDLLIQQMRTAFGGIYLGDILLDKPVQGLDLLSATLPTLPFDSDKVLDADSFAIQLVCPFSYDPLGIKEVLEKAQQTETALSWLDIRFANYNIRLQNLDRMAIPCGLPGVFNQDSYQRFKSVYLP